jgi:hypothetical protein
MEESRDVAIPQQGVTSVIPRIGIEVNTEGTGSG